MARSFSHARKVKEPPAPEVEADDLACQGSNHVPGCEHFSPKTSKPDDEGAS